MFIAKITLPAKISGTKEPIIYSVRNDIRNSITVEWFCLDLVKKFTTRQKARLAAREGLAKANFLWRENAIVETIELTPTITEELVFLYLKNH